MQNGTWIYRPVPRDLGIFGVSTDLTSGMLDLQDISRQLSELARNERPEFDRLRAAHALAQDVLREFGKVWEDYSIDKLERKDKALVARPHEDPTGSWPAPERPVPITAVATDGSQVFPDPHYMLTCCLVNVSRIAFQYGTAEPPVMEARARVASRVVPHIRQPLTVDLVAAWRDQLETEDLLDTAVEARRSGRPIVAIADGTLIRWTLQGIDSSQTKEFFLTAFTQTLSKFRHESIPICAYVSLPNSTEVANLLRIYRNREDLAGLRDRDIYATRLAAGHRSALFESASLIKAEYDSEDQIFFFYVCVDGDIGRVEIPRWVAHEEKLVDLIHTVVVSECAKGNGYPMILTEAHERAVVRANERDTFYFILERELAKSGIHLTHSRKAQSKRRPVI